MFAVSECF